MCDGKIPCSSCTGTEISILQLWFFIHSSEYRPSSQKKLFCFFVYVSVRGRQCIYPESSTRYLDTIDMPVTTPLHTSMYSEQTPPSINTHQVFGWYTLVFRIFCFLLHTTPGSLLVICKGWQVYLATFAYYKQGATKQCINNGRKKHFFLPLLMHCIVRNPWTAQFCQAVYFHVKLSIWWLVEV
jgi:hypothetical protein